MATPKRCFRQIGREHGPPFLGTSRRSIAAAYDIFALRYCAAGIRLLIGAALMDLRLRHRQCHRQKEGIVSYKVEKIEGVGPKYAAKLDKVGIKSTKQLLERAATRKGRKDLAVESGIDETLILKWANMSDLMRIKGVGEEFSELLEVAGVDTVKELAKRRADNLRQAMVDANEKRKLVRQLPGVSQVEDWVNQAKTIEPMMKY
jgi:predicted flap endonuclease-1-like 5' DNA nuclease